MATTKSSSSKSASKQKIQAGPSGKMQKFVPVKQQKSGQSGVSNSGSFAKSKR